MGSLGNFLQSCIGTSIRAEYRANPNSKSDSIQGKLMLVETENVPVPESKEGKTLPEIKMSILSEGVLTRVGLPSVVSIKLEDQYLLHVLSAYSIDICKDNW